MMEVTNEQSNLSIKIVQIYYYGQKSGGRVTPSKTLDLIYKAVQEFETERRKEERKKIAEEVKALEIGDITTAMSIYNAILKGGNG